MKQARPSPFVALIVPQEVVESAPGSACVLRSFGFLLVLSDHDVLDRTSQWGGPSISPPPSTQGWLHVRGTVEVAGGVWEGDVAHLEGALEGHAG